MVISVNNLHYNHQASEGDMIVMLAYWGADGSPCSDVASALIHLLVKYS